VSGIAADMGVVYSSGAIMAENGSERPAVIEPTDIACVGSRAPHIWLDSDGDRLSIHDLFGHRLVLLTGVNGGAWRHAAHHVGDSLRVPLGAITIGGTELTARSSDWTTMYGIASDGAVLVRPDGHIAWRSPSAAADAIATLETVVARVLSRGRTQNGELAPSLAMDRRCA